MKYAIVHPDGTVLATLHNDQSFEHVKRLFPLAQPIEEVPAEAIEQFWSDVDPDGSWRRGEQGGS